MKLDADAARGEILGREIGPYLPDPLGDGLKSILRDFDELISLGIGAVLLPLEPVSSMLPLDWPGFVRFSSRVGFLAMSVDAKSLRESTESGENGFPGVKT